MRRTIALGLLVLAAATLAGLRPFHEALAAVQYPSGWNLVSGPEGSHLSGASGSIYSQQPGDLGYESFPADAALKGGWAYWAFFPNGGGLVAAPGQTSYSVTLQPGAYAMIGDPSATGDATVTGADLIQTYDPVTGWHVANTIPAGKGAFVLAQGTISLTAAAPPDTSPPPVTQPSPVTPPPQSGSQNLQLPAVATTPAGLFSIGLHTSDLPSGYQFSGPLGLQFSANPVLAAEADGIWFNTNPNSSNVYIEEIMLSLTVGRNFKLADVFSDVFSSLNVQGAIAMGSAGVGDEDQIFFGTFDLASIRPTYPHRMVNRYFLFFRRGPVVVSLDTGDYAPADSRSLLIAVGNQINARLAAAGVPSSTQYSSVTPQAGLAADVPER
jgi:hypothetical protein